MKQEDTKAPLGAAPGYAARDPFEVLIERLESVDEVWDASQYTVTHRESGVSVWIANCPALDTNTYPAPIIGAFQLWKKWRLIRAARRAVANNAARKLMKRHNEVAERRPETK